MTKYQHDLLEILYQAINAEHGVVVETNKLEYTRQLFYKAMKTDPAFDNLTITRNRTNPDTELLIMRKQNG